MECKFLNYSEQLIHYAFTAHLNHVFIYNLRYQDKVLFQTILTINKLLFRKLRYYYILYCSCLGKTKHLELKQDMI